MRKINFIKYFLIIFISIVLGCSASSFDTNKKKIHGKWEEIVPNERIYLDSNICTYIFKTDSFFVSEKPFNPSPYIVKWSKSINKGSGVYYPINNKIFFNGVYNENYIQETSYKLHISRDSMWSEVVSDTVYGFKEIKRAIDEEYIYSFKGDTLILYCDKKYTKRYFVREQ